MEAQVWWKNDERILEVKVTGLEVEVSALMVGVSTYTSGEKTGGE